MSKTYQELRKEWDEARDRAVQGGAENVRRIADRIAAAKRAHGEDEWADAHERADR